jgi:hypothetical protein
MGTGQPSRHEDDMRARVVGSMTLTELAKRGFAGDGDGAGLGEGCAGAALLSGVPAAGLVCSCAGAHDMHTERDRTTTVDRVLMFIPYGGLTIAAVEAKVTGGRIVVAGDPVDTSRRRKWIGAVGTALALVLLGGSAAAQEQEEPAGASLTGCTGTATSTDADGEPLGSVTAPGGGGASKDRPFLVDADGTVTYQGASRAVIKNHSWSVRLYGIPIRTGGSENDENKKTTKGTEEISAYIPFRITGLYYVSGGISGEGGSCDGAVWVKLTGNPIGTVPWLVGLLFAVGGAALTWASRPTALFPVAAKRRTEPEPAAPPSAPPPPPGGTP